MKQKFSPKLIIKPKYLIALGMCFSFLLGLSILTSQVLDDRDSDATAAGEEVPMGDISIPLDGSAQTLVFPYKADDFADRNALSRLEIQGAGLFSIDTNSVEDWYVPWPGHPNKPAPDPDDPDDPYNLYISNGDFVVSCSGEMNENQKFGVANLGTGSLFEYNLQTARNSGSQTGDNSGDRELFAEHQGCLSLNVVLSEATCDDIGTQARLVFQEYVNVGNDGAGLDPLPSKVFNLIIADPTDPNMCDTGGGEEPPIANADAVSTNMNTPVTINVLDNDSIASGSIDPNTLEITNQPANGVAAVTQGGSGIINYTPDGGYSGEDSFTYRVANGEGAFSNEAFVLISVFDTTIPNESPTAVDDTAATVQNVPVTINVGANDSDPDGSLDPSSISIVENPIYGSLDTTSYGGVIYTPELDFSGQDFFTYNIKDNRGQVSNTAKVSITVSETDTGPGQANLKIITTGDKSSLKQGSDDELIYTYVYSNSSDVPAAATKVITTLDRNLEFVSCSGGCNSNNLPYVVWELGVVEPAEQNSVTMTVKLKTVASPGEVTNTAIIQSPTDISDSQSSYSFVIQPSDKPIDPEKIPSNTIDPTGSGGASGSGGGQGGGSGGSSGGGSGGSNQGSGAGGSGSDSSSADPADRDTSRSGGLATLSGVLLTIIPTIALGFYYLSRYQNRFKIRGGGLK
jgi:uncharacterized repeat protein (TIGR01451 family)